MDVGPKCTRLESHPKGAPETKKQLIALAERAGVHPATAIKWLAHLPVYRPRAIALEAALAAIRAERGMP